MDCRVFLFGILPALQIYVAEEYDDIYWTNYNYTMSSPYFDTSFSKNVTLLVGQTAYLRCRPLHSENRLISWIRYRDLHLLTVGLQTYTNDQRFQATHIPRLNVWTLGIKYVQTKDTGIYMCQSSTVPPAILYLHLLVVETNVRILGEPEIYISEYSLVNLTCIVEYITGLPFHLKWSHNNKEINYNTSRGGVSVMTEKKDDQIKSYLLIQNAVSSDSGKYACSPVESISEEIIVHVLTDSSSMSMRQRVEMPLVILTGLLRCILLVLNI